MSSTLLTLPDAGIMGSLVPRYYVRFLPKRLRDHSALSVGGLAIVRNVLWLGGERVVRLLIGFFVGAWVGRYLGPERFGLLAYVVAFVSIFQAVATLGSDIIITRDLVRYPEHAHRLLGTLLRLRIIAGFACWSIAIVLSWLIDPTVTTTVMVAIVGSTLVFQSADTIDLWFQSRLQSRRTVVVKVIAYSLSNLLRVVLILSHAPVVAFAAFTAVDSFAAAVGLMVAYRRHPTRDRWSRSGVIVASLLKQSWPFLLSSLSVLVYMRVDQIMLRRLASAHELGLFAAAAPLSAVWQMIPVTLAASLTPLVARRKEQDEALYRRTMLEIYRGFGVVSLLLAILTALASPLIVNLLYGRAFAGAAPVLAVHVFSNVFIALGVAQSLWISNEGAGGINLLKNLFGGFVAVLGNILLIPAYGAVGAAWVTILAFAVSGVLSNLVLAPEVFLNQFGIDASLPVRTLIRTKRVKQAMTKDPI